MTRAIRRPCMAAELAVPVRPSRWRRRRKASHRPVRRRRTLPRGARGVLRSTWLAPSTGGPSGRNRMTVGGKNKLSRMYRDFSCKTAVTCEYDLNRGKDLAMPIRHIYLTAMLAAASAALASTLAAAPPAAADCISASGPDPVTLCSQGDPGRATRHPSLGPLLISRLTVLRTGCATRASASLSVTEGSGGDCDLGRGRRADDRGRSERTRHRRLCSPMCLRSPKASSAWKQTRTRTTYASCPRPFATSVTRSRTRRFVYKTGGLRHAGQSPTDSRTCTMSPSSICSGRRSATLSGTR